MESEAMLVSGEAGAVDRGQPLSVAADVATREAWRITSDVARAEHQPNGPPPQGPTDYIIAWIHQIG